MHEVTVDHQRQLIIVTLNGFFTADDTDAAAIDLHKAIRSLGPGTGQHLTLYDMTRMQVAPGDALDRFRSYFTDPAFAKIWARKVALVTSSALATLQMRRVKQVRTNIEVFDNRDAAMAWLLAA